MTAEHRGPRVRTDIVDVYVLRPAGASHELLLLRRAFRPMVGQWHPIMGHVEHGERAMDTALRELGEEIGATAAHIREWHQLEQTFPFFMAERDEVHVSPRFVVQLEPAFDPTLNDEHDAHRWIPIESAERELLWPGQRHALREIAEHILPGGPTADALRLRPPGLG